MASPRRWLSIRETAEMLSLHPKTIYNLVLRGELPSCRIGGSWRVDGKKLEEQMEKEAGKK